MSFHLPTYAIAIHRKMEADQETRTRRLQAMLQDMQRRLARYPGTDEGKYYTPECSLALNWVSRFVAGGQIINTSSAVALRSENP